MNMKNALELWPKPEKLELAMEIGWDVLALACNESEASTEKLGALQDLYIIHLEKVASKHSRFLDLLHLAKILAMADMAFNLYERPRTRKLLIWPYRMEDDAFSYEQAKMLGLCMLHPMVGMASEADA